VPASATKSQSSSRRGRRPLVSLSVGSVTMGRDKESGTSAYHGPRPSVVGSKGEGRTIAWDADPDYRCDLKLAATTVALDMCPSTESVRRS